MEEMLSNGVKELMSHLVEPTVMVLEEVDDPDYYHVFIGDPNGGRTERIPRWSPKRNHEFETLEGFISYLNSKHCEKDSGVIFACDEGLAADLAYQNPGKHIVNLKLCASEEFKALNALFSGVGQKQLWRLLISKLAGCFDESLLLQIASLKIESKDDLEVHIGTLGAKKSANGSQINISSGETSGKISTDWTFKGRLWECFEDPYEIPVTLEVDTSEGLKFIFHPHRLGKIVRTAREDLVARVREGINSERFTVHEGRI